MRNPVPERPPHGSPDSLPESAETELILRALQQGKIARPAPMPPVRQPTTGSDQRSQNEKN